MNSTQSGSSNDKRSRRNRKEADERPRRARGDAKLELLQQSLLSVIAQVGAFGVTHRAVAREAGVSLSATTYYFESKQDMVRKAFLYLSEKFTQSLGSFAERYHDVEQGLSKPVDEAAAAGLFLRSRLQASTSENLTLMELLLTVARDEEARRLLASDRETVRSFVVDLMKDSRSSRPDEDADLLMALATGLILESLARGRPADFEKRAIMLAERVMGWIVADDSGDGASHKRKQ